jgi:L-cysteine S-thiosulfotransferase
MPLPGKAVAEDRGKGNCLACHMIVGAESPGAIGPA